MTLSADLLLHAYASGVFPMAESRDDPEVFWVDPKRRGILPLDGFRISRSLGKRLRRDDYEISVNRDFAGVVHGCADREETWINEEIFDRYLELHLMGFARGLLGRHIGRSAQEFAFHRHRDLARLALGQTEVHYVRFTLGVQDDIGWLEITMDNSIIV